MVLTYVKISYLRRILADEKKAKEMKNNLAYCALHLAIEISTEVQTYWG